MLFSNITILNRYSFNYLKETQDYKKAKTFFEKVKKGKNGKN